jgi:hypothetical protein
MKDYSHFPDDQFLFLLHNLIKEKIALRNWYREQDNERLYRRIDNEVRILKDTYRRLDDKQTKRT